MAPAEALIRPMTCGSPDLATKSTPVTPAAPLLFSTITGWPRKGEMRSARLRPKMSAGPPAGKGTTRVQGRLGKFWWAWAPMGEGERGSGANPPAATRRVIFKASPPNRCAKSAQGRGDRQGHWRADLEVRAPARQDAPLEWRAPSGSYRFFGLPCRT